MRLPSKKQRKAQELNWAKAMLKGAVGSVYAVRQRLAQFAPETSTQLEPHLRTADVSLQLAVGLWDEAVWKKGEKGKDDSKSS